MGYVMVISELEFRIIVTFLGGIDYISFIEGCTQLDVVVRQNIYIHKRTYLLLINAYYKLWTLLHSQALIEGAR